MRVPAEKMEIIGSFEGKTSENGWLVLDIRRADLDGVNKLYINLDDLESLKGRKREQADAFAKARELLGGL